MGAAAAGRTLGAIGLVARPSVLILALAQASGVSAQSAPPAAAAPAPAAEPAAPNDEIVVVAQPEERSSIDRTTYVVRDTPEARSSSSLDLLAHVPFVDVNPNGQIRLLGTGGVRILIDGKEVADANAMLRNLQGSQIAKIEVISNPSAQFSARGTGGIINIVTRRSLTGGLGGSVTANGDNFGTAEIKVSPTWAGGRLSLSGSLDVARSRTLGTETDQDRYRVGANGDLVPESMQQTTNRNGDDEVSGNLMISYKPTAKQTISLTAFAVAEGDRSSSMSDLSFAADPAVLFRETSRSTGSLNLQDVSADYRREGSRDGETLTASAKWSSFDWPSDTMFQTIGGPNEASAFTLRSDWHRSDATLKFDYVRPFGTKRRLSFGAMLERVRDEMLDRQDGENIPGGPNLALFSEVDGSWLEESAYVTYQAPFLGGTLLPGLRVEGRRYSFANGAAVGPGRHHLFPSLHLERKLAKTLTADLSYSRRIAWPEISALDPSLRFSDPRTAFAGNPSLRPEITHAFEAKLSLRGAKRNVEVTAFSRKTENSFSSLSELDPNGVLVTRQVNFGTRLLRGASVVIQGSIGRRLSYSLSGNLADEQLRSNGPGPAPAGFGMQYGGSAKVEYRDGKEGRGGADHVTLTAHYSGPNYSGFSRYSAALYSDGSWSHALTDRLSSVLKIADLAGPFTFRSTSVSADSVSRSIFRRRDRRITLSFTYSLGKRPSQ
jgi:outer membrane receptor protein involved in Fe transport